MMATKGAILISLGKTESLWETVHR